MNSRMCALALWSVVAFPCSLWAQISIAPICCIKNQPPGRCGWCAVETLARHHRVEVLYGLTENHPCVASPYDLQTELDKVKVAYRIEYPSSSPRLSLLRDACDKKLGAVVGFRPLHEGGGGHIVTLVDIADEYVRVIDPNDECGRVRTLSLQRFLYWWDGFTLILNVKKQAVPSRK